MDVFCGDYPVVIVNDIIIYPKCCLLISNRQTNWIKTVVYYYRFKKMKSLLERINWSECLSRTSLSEIYKTADDYGNISSVIKLTKIVNVPGSWPDVDFLCPEVSFNPQSKVVSVGSLGDVAVFGENYHRYRDSQNERKFLERFQDVENVVKIKGHEFLCHKDSSDNNVFCSGIEMEYLEGTILFKMIRSRGRNISDFCKAIGDMAELLLFFEDERFIYMDVKSSNVIYQPKEVSGRGKTTLIDFNLSIDEENLSLNHLGGTLEYNAPEKINKNTYPITARADFFALGGIVYEYFLRQYPRLKGNPADDKKRIRKMTDEIFHAGCPDGLLDGVKKVFEHDPDDREILPLMQACYEIAGMG